MTHKSPTPILLDTVLLSRLISDVLDAVGAPASKKSACLNKAASRIAGPKQNWGSLTSQDTPIIARGVSGYDVVETPAPGNAWSAGPEVSTVPLKFYPDALHEGLVSGKKVILVSAPLGVGCYASIVKASEKMKRRHYSIRTSLFLEDEIVERHGSKRLQEQLRPRTGYGDVTIYEDVDVLCHKGIKALEHELDLIAQTQPTAQVILMTNFHDRLISALSEVAPDLLERALPIQVENPTLNDINDILCVKPTIGETEPSTPSYPSKDAWDKAGQIMHEAQIGVDALREANDIVHTADKDRNFETKDHRIETLDLSALLAFMEIQENMSPRVIAYMRTHSKIVTADLIALSVSSKAWQDVARLMYLLEDAGKSGSEALQSRHAILVCQYTQAHLGRSVQALLHVLDF
jgi:hypothetical protein